MDDYDYCQDCTEEDYWECHCCPRNPANRDNPDYDPMDI